MDFTKYNWLDNRSLFFLLIWMLTVTTVSVRDGLHFVFNFFFVKYYSCLPKWWYLIMDMACWCFAFVLSNRCTYSYSMKKLKWWDHMGGQLAQCLDSAEGHIAFENQGINMTLQKDQMYLSKHSFFLFFKFSCTVILEMQFIQLNFQVALLFIWIITSHWSKHQLFTEDTIKQYEALKTALLKHDSLVLRFVFPLHYFFSAGSLS